MANRYRDFLCMWRLALVARKVFRTHRTMPGGLIDPNVCGNGTRNFFLIATYISTCKTDSPF